MKARILIMYMDKNGYSIFEQEMVFYRFRRSILKSIFSICDFCDGF